ncbi:hypothetical protein, variant [Fonticula alba]|uniref:Protein ARV n=1 Tax=Fonticula alba TaxID=691883 RepID=A0A058Z5G8_FONAL|nr:hypothetical protein, variant [Fonticula alba]KCV69188.1 hypothetical protein, variant [Fonticula alba]|eukprot:XP_009496759.1 hypothetical protein, variant [Fonticula alba]
MYPSPCSSIVPRCLQRFSAAAAVVVAAAAAASDTSTADPVAVAVAAIAAASAAVLAAPVATMPCCVTCGARMEYLFREHGAGPVQIRQIVCSKCNQPGDPYYERPFALAAIDFILHRPQAHRHIHFNRIGLGPACHRDARSLGILTIVIDLLSRWLSILPPSALSPLVLEPSAQLAAFHAYTSILALPAPTVLLLVVQYFFELGVFFHALRLALPRLPGARTDVSSTHLVQTLCIASFARMVPLILMRIWFNEADLASTSWLAYVYAVSCVGLSLSGALPLGSWRVCP